MRNPSARPAAGLAGICSKTRLRMVFTRSLSARASASRARSCRTASPPNAAASGCAFAPVFYGQVSVVVAVRATPVAPVPVAAFADAIAWTVRVPAAPPGTHCAMPFWLMVAMEADCHPFCGEVRHRLPPARTDGDLQNRCRESLDRRCCRNPNPTGTKTKTEKPGLPEAPIATRCCPPRRGPPPPKYGPRVGVAGRYCAR